MSKLIVDVDEDLHYKFKQYSIKKKISMKKIITDFVKRCVKNA